MANIMKGVMKSRQVKKLEIAFNEIGKESSQIIQEIVGDPNHKLKSLIIQDCKILATPIDQIFKELQIKCSLRTLKLIKASLNAQNLLTLSDIINNQITLHNLDISWNDFPQKGVHLSGNDLSMHLVNAIEIKLKIIKKDKQKDEYDDLIDNDFDQVELSARQDQLQKKNQIFLNNNNDQQQNKLYEEVPAYTSVLFQNKSDNLSLNSSVFDIKFPISNNKSKGRFQIMPKDLVIFQRQLGHCEIKDAYKWVRSNFCWHCEKWQYIIIVFPVKYEQSDLQIYHKKMLKKLPNKADDEKILIQRNVVKEIVENYTFDCQINGTFVNNGFQKMMNMNDFIGKLEDNLETHYQFGERFVNSQDHELIYRKKRKKMNFRKNNQYLELKRKQLDYLYHLQKCKIPINQAKQYFEELDQKQELNEDEILLLSYRNIDLNYNKKQMQKIMKLSNDYNPLIVNCNQINSDSNDLRKISQNQQDLCNFTISEEVFFYAQIVPPGTHHFKVVQKNKFTTLNQSQQNIIPDPQFQTVIEVPQRQKELNVFYKKKKKNRYVNQFSHTKSVFKQWKEDTQESLEELVLKELAKSKLNRIIRSLGDMKIPDKNCPMNKIDMAFIASNVELEKNDDNPDRDLQRFEFFEILVRIANEKFRKPGIVEKFSQGLKKLLIENIFPNFNPIMEFQEFRVRHLWSQQVDDVIRVNRAGIKRLYESQLTLNKRFWNMKDVIFFICNLGRELNLTELQVKTAFVYSKMTIIDEDEELKKYQQMNLVEFLEFLGRIAHLVKIPENIHQEIVARMNHVDEIGLPEKLEYVLDLLLGIINVKRKPRESIKDQFDSESDYD